LISPCCFAVIIELIYYTLFCWFTKGTVSKIFSEEDENGNPAYKELHIMWEVLGSKEQILKYGMKHLQNKQKGR